MPVTLAAHGGVYSGLANVGWLAVVLSTKVIGHTGIWRSHTSTVQELSLINKLSDDVVVLVPMSYFRGVMSM